MQSFRRAASTAAKTARSCVYELRTYSIKPESFTDFLKLTDKHINLRTAHSELTAYWVTELGGINEVVHIWRYDSLEKRQAVRSALAVDQDWQTLYFSKILPLMTKQENSLLLPLEWYTPPKSSAAEGIFELRTYTVQPTKVPSWLKEFRTYQEVRARHMLPVALWKSEIGTVNQIVHLYKYDSLDQRMAAREAAFTDPEFVTAVEKSGQFVQNMSTKILRPLRFSPLQINYKFV